MKLGALPKGTFFTKKPIEYPTEMQVWIRGSYDRVAKKYECCRFGDMNDVILISGAKEVFVDFIF